MTRPNQTDLTLNPFLSQRHLYRLAMLSSITAALWLTTSPAVAFDLNSDSPISVSADSARLDDSKGEATYTGDVVVTQDQTRLTADRVVLYRDQAGVQRIEAFGTPARYKHPAMGDQAETDAQALEITYTAKDSQLTLEEEAVIEQASNIFRGDRIEYDITARIVTAEGTTRDGEPQGRVEMVIQPRSGAARPASSSDSSTTGDKP
ncbi:lipopolysaccharide transport periplasmic protein LptA [Marinobacter changyiensis]|uniref:lipopolysaccharide transport periplasmic protein LptA n=1 Tax=Marinobacter changyiensis TaxID=2604091 RepID=UPI001FE81FAC|nr:lipopolysaccharide transport periplasmic protein LptA [Marinobacter changyiensis]